MKVLVVGSGGREHALVWSLIHTSRRAVKVFCAPGNAGIAQLAETVDIDVTDIKGLADFAAAQEIDLTIVGGETALAAGIADEFARRNLLIAAPTKDAARLESSKSFAKSFMTRHKIPTAHHCTVASLEAAQECLRSGEFGDADTPVVVKADGLAAGKGVHVTASHTEALLRVEELMSANADTASPAVVVLEEKLEGAEASLLLWTDGRDYALMPVARDHKRIGENDTGANTGGMGVITSHGILDAATLEEIKRTIIEPTLRGAREEGFEFRGVLYIGLMLTADGARVIEYNARLGDPETQAILVRLRSDAVEIFQAVARGKLGEINVEWSEDASACVVLAARGYPHKPETGHVIEGLETFDMRDDAGGDVRVFHAATTRRNNQWLTAGGRVLGVTATAAHLDDALAKCYDAITRIKWDGMNYRRDIGRFMRDD